MITKYISWLQNLRDKSNERWQGRSKEAWLVGTGEGWITEIRWPGSRSQLENRGQPGLRLGHGGDGCQASKLREFGHNLGRNPDPAGAPSCRARTPRSTELQVGWAQQLEGAGLRQGQVYGGGDCRRAPCPDLARAPRSGQGVRAVGWTGSRCRTVAWLEGSAQKLVGSGKSPHLPDLQLPSHARWIKQQLFYLLLLLVKKSTS